MITLIHGNIFDSKCQALVCPVNTKGVMGAGLAKQFAERYPDCVEVYKETAIEDSRAIQKGGDIFFDDMSIWDYTTNSKIIIYFATREDYNNPSKLEWIEKGLQQFVEHYKVYKITSVAFPMLGCGLGGLSKTDVITLFNKYLFKEQIWAEVYDNN